jgi:chemotaxis protein CheX
MDVQNINIFLEALNNVLGLYGIDNIKNTNVIKKEVMNVTMDITALIGITGDVKGNIAYSFSTATAKKLISAKWGEEVKNINSSERIALEKIIDMITNKAGELFQRAEKSFKITAPSFVMGKDMVFVISSVDTISVDVDTSIGKIQVNIGLEN